ncbi:MAG: sensor domain-containing diguanylate cyclase [Planctomycetota bacterium]|jgi:diguanylate cyclase (GGDEF)-like protein
MSSDLLDKVLSCPNLPSLPSVAMQVLEVARDPDLELSQIADVVQHDQALCGKILRTVNSSYYGLAKPCPTITRALGYLGLSTVKSLVLGFSLVDSTSGTNAEFDLIHYWRRCLHAAAAARRIASTTEKVDPEEAFLAALMEDIGMLAIYEALGPRYLETVRQTGGDHEQLPTLETEGLGFTHAEAGARLAERWRLPGQLVASVRYHHRNVTGSEQFNQMVNAVLLAAQVSQVLTASHPKSAMAQLYSMASMLFGISPDDARALVSGTSEDVCELSTLLEVNVGDPIDVSRLLARAEDVKIEHEVQMRREADQLRESNEQLARQAMTDGLTQVGNRQRFDQELDSLFQQAKAFNGCLALILVDADDFKRINDTHGHPVGDAVLVELARRLTDHLGDRGLVCRYGGEEFAILVSGAERPQAAKMAESLRKALEARPMDLRAGNVGTDSVAVTASFGVAVLEPAVVEVLASPHRLIQAADGALYAAKQAGRNCVRVFNPNLGTRAA